MNKADFKKVLKDLPSLTIEGIGVGMHHYSTRQEYIDLVSELRERLISSAFDNTDTGNLVEYWLSHFTPKKTASSKDLGSYGLKHDCEETIGIYVPNGLFIAVAHHLGFPIHIDGNLNPKIGIRQSELKRLSSRSGRMRGTFDVSLLRPHPLYQQDKYGCFILNGGKLVLKMSSQKVSCR